MALLSLENQNELLKASWKLVKETVVINLDVAMEDTEEISKIMRQAPENIKRNGRW